MENFQGFFDQQGEPLYPNGATISSMVQRTHNACVDTSSLVIIELWLESISKLGTITQVLEAAVEGHFAPTPKKLATHYLMFNVTSITESHLNKMKKLVHKLERYVANKLYYHAANHAAGLDINERCSSSIPIPTMTMAACSWGQMTRARVLPFQ